MKRKHQQNLLERVRAAAETILAAQNYVSAIDVLRGTGWLTPDAERRWRHGRVDCLESVIHVNLARISHAMKLFRAWAAEKGLYPSETDYVARTVQRQKLRFSRSNHPEIERWYRTHWVSPRLSEQKRARLSEKVSRPPELVAVQPLNHDWTCHRCGGSGSLLVMEAPGPACLHCLGLGDLEYLPAGDALLTRRAKARSAKHVVVVRFSKRRKRYERQGMLVEPAALIEVRRALESNR